MVSGTGFDLIQRATMKVLPSADEFSEDTPADVVSVGPETVFVCDSEAGPTASLCSQYFQEALSKNDTMLQFYSPTVNCSCNIQSLKTVLYLDNVVEELKGFDYHPNPSFNELLKNVITETSIIIVTVRTPPHVRRSASSASRS